MAGLYLEAANARHPAYPYGVVFPLLVTEGGERLLWSHTTRRDRWTFNLYLHPSGVWLQAHFKVRNGDPTLFTVEFGEEGVDGWFIPGKLYPRHKEELEEFGGRLEEAASQTGSAILRRFAEQVAQVLPLVPTPTSPTPDDSYPNLGPSC